MNSTMKIVHQIFYVVLALFACLILFIIYAAIGGFLGWRSGGGAIPSLILFAAMIGAFRAIMKWGRNRMERQAMQGL